MRAASFVFTGLGKCKTLAREKRCVFPQTFEMYTGFHSLEWANETLACAGWQELSHILLEASLGPGISLAKTQGMVAWEAEHGQATRHVLESDI